MTRGNSAVGQRRARPGGRAGARRERRRGRRGGGRTKTGRRPDNTASYSLDVPAATAAVTGRPVYAVATSCVLSAFSLDRRRDELDTIKTSLVLFVYLFFLSFSRL